MATIFTYEMTDVIVSQLTAEIVASSIVTALQGIDHEDDDITVTFKADLAAEDETTLDALVGAHTPAMIQAGQPEPVLIHEINAETQQVEAVQYAFSEGRNRVLASTKPVVPGKVLYFYWTGQSDEVSTPAECIIGGGEDILITIPSGQAEASIDLKFGNYNAGELVYLAGGAFQWKDTEWGDSLSMEVIADPTPTQQMANLDFNVVDDKLVATAPGTGTHGLAGTPIFVPSYCKEGWWNLTPDFQAEFRPGQDGMYDWHTTERVAANFVNRLPLFGTETKGLQLSSPETSNLPAGYFLRLHMFTGNEADHEWHIAGSIMMFRECVGND